MADDPNTGAASIILKLTETPSPRFTITCKDKRDFFEQFKKKCHDLGVQLKDITWMDEDNEPAFLDNPVAFSDYMLRSYYTQRLYITKCPGNELDLNWDEIDSDPEITKPSDGETKQISMKLITNVVPQFHIQYKDKSSLYETFKEKTRQLNLPVNSIFWRDDDDEIRLLIDADELMNAVKCKTTLRLYVRRDVNSSS